MAKVARERRPNVKLGEYACFFCCSPSGLELSTCKTGWMFNCLRCRTRVFIYHELGFSGPRQLWGVAFSLEDMAKRGAVAAPVSTSGVAGRTG